jgi:hypothetical protein
MKFDYIVKLNVRVAQMIPIYILSIDRKIFGVATDLVSYVFGAWSIVLWQPSGLPTTCKETNLVQ